MFIDQSQVASARRRLAEHDLERCAFSPPWLQFVELVRARDCFMLIGRGDQVVLRGNTVALCTRKSDIEQTFAALSGLVGGHRDHGGTTGDLPDARAPNRIDQCFSVPGA